MDGRDPQLIADIALKLPSPSFYDVESYKSHLIYNLSIAWKENQKRIAHSVNHYKAEYDKHANPNSDINIGSTVLLREDANQPKLSHDWKGPYRVIEISKPNVVISPVGTPSKQEKVHFNRLKLYTHRVEVTSLISEHKEDSGPMNEKDEPVPLRRSNASSCAI
ncbi:hypothetical protein ANCDUO_05599 [Ancylostoma duodenale]|uniref:Integrase zinc-binding domain-containing protein n=1 Tax=Ancylostoma duodenale TaxID=51022 RepID=A0A0C2D3N2_9BILA|nr:hypothetical protein ANCDUO_05599 [Ancylostoma duodenale]